MSQSINKRPFCTLSGEVVHGRGIGKLVGMFLTNKEFAVWYMLYSNPDIAFIIIEKA